MANEPVFHLITAIGNTEKEAHISHLLHTQNWNISYRALDGNLLSSYLNNAQILPQSILIFSRDLPTWKEDFLEQADHVGVFAICIDECEFTSHLIMEHIRHALRSRATEYSDQQSEEVTQRTAIRGGVGDENVHVATSYAGRREGFSQELERRSPTRGFGDIRDIEEPEFAPLNNSRSSSIFPMPSRVNDLYVFTGGGGGSGISTLSVATALCLSNQERVNLVELENDYPSHHFLTGYQERSNRERFMATRNSTRNNQIREWGDSSPQSSRSSSPWRNRDQSMRNNPTDTNRSYSGNRSGFSIREFDLSRHDETIRELLLDAPSIVDIGRMPSLDGLMSDRRKRSMAVHDLLNTATHVIYCLKADRLHLKHLSKFLNEMHSQKYQWNITFAINMVHKGKKDKVLIAEVADLIHGYRQVSIDFDPRCGEYFPAKQAIAGGFGKQVNQLIQVIR